MACEGTFEFQNLSRKVLISSLLHICTNFIADLKINFVQLSIVYEPKTKNTIVYRPPFYSSLIFATHVKLGYFKLRLIDPS